MTKHNLFSSEKNLPFQYEAAKRIDFLDYTKENLQSFIKHHCTVLGKPLVVSNMHKSNGWSDAAFSLERLKTYCGNLEVDLDLQKQAEVKKTKAPLGSYIESIQHKYKFDQPVLNHHEKLPFSIEKVYAKDIVCPNEYQTALRNFLPEYLLPHGSEDLFTFLPDRFKAENLMCYVGQDMTGTPIHRDLCGTMGHNVMTMASEDAFAEWLIVECQHRDDLACLIDPEDDDHQRHFRHIGRNKRRSGRPSTAVNSHVTKSSFMESDRAWLNYDKILKANFKVQVIVQRKGDLVIIPSRAYHQVRNSGISIKVAWNRITPQTLTFAFQDQLPLYRIISRPEVYKCKAIVSFTLQEWNRQINDLVRDQSKRTYSIPILCYGSDNFIENSRQLLDIFLEKVILPELLFDDDKEGIVADAAGEVCTVKCDFCHGDIFCHYYHCDICNQYDLCLDCYSIGRSCQHVTEMQMYKSPESIMNAVKTYLNYVKNVNATFNGDLIPNRSLDVLRNSPHDHPANLATTCRRIERYRRKRSHNFNILECNHCSAATTVSELGEQGISLLSIFKRSWCKHASRKARQEGVNYYTCLSCVERCRSCQPLEVNTESLKDYDLVYYLHPSHDERNRGGFIDLDMKRTCDIPQTTKKMISTSRGPSRKKARK
ncbi:uncharacterized protein B0P05DRAFT_637625 [Gilbertella persicaria]|uniref:JmjC domain-containing protein n=1 Tax=Rhizopus stolonifer TaxID=4846 RepID=A0A367J2U8_RHIST|nr:uncharacterized protein B0P05DRAFT_637625 [Gilbertella persicaria]KAI8078107.1 hypothetical protein B0P05DRAFT_637625 [Gilbertella persicaria]RCH84233.1 hypothetical protein CU098_004882 [Rhizopus stolonifer]